MFHNMMHFSIAACSLIVTGGDAVIGCIIQCYATSSTSPVILITSSEIIIVVAFKIQHARRIHSADRVVPAVGKHVIAQEALTGGNKGVGVEESAPGGVVITALEIIEASFLDMLVAIMLIFVDLGLK